MKPKPPNASKTVMTDLVLPSDTNHINNLFGGELLARMDRAACISESAIHSILLQPLL